MDACADFNAWITEVTMQRPSAAGVIVTTSVSVLAELAGNTQVNGKHIGQLLGDRVGQYYAAMNTYPGTAGNANMVAQGVGLTGTPPIPAILK